METTIFNPKNQESLTYREALDPAMKITEQADADQYKEAYIKWQMKNGVSLERATEIVNVNLGYYAGYYSNETRERVERLFKTSHPFFGSISQNSAPTNEEAYQMGLKLGSEH